MAAKKPESPEEYRDWLESELGVDITLEKTHYDTAAQLIKAQFSRSPFWHGIAEQQTLQKSR